MNVYKLEKNKINGINIPENSIICTIQEKITIRLIGESTPFIEAELEEFRNSSDASFATLDAFITYFNLNFNTGISLEAADIQIGAVELKDASTTQRATITLVGSKGALATQVVDAAGNQITSFGSPSTVADYRNPADFTAAYTTSSTMTLSGYNFQLDSGAQIVYIRQRKANNTANVYVNGASGYAFYLDPSTGIVTIYKDGVVSSVLASTDMYEVGINSSTKAYDITTDSNKSFVNNYPVQPIGGELLNVALTDALTATGCILNIAAANITPSGALKGTIAVGTGNDQVTAGQTYVVGQTLLITGGNTDAIVTVATVVAGTVGNKVATVTVVAGGSGYTVNATNATTLVTINYYPSVDGIDMGYYRNISFQYLANLTTPSNIYTAIEISNEDTPTMWLNATKTGYISAGSQAGSTGLVHILAENGAIDFDNILAKKVRLRSIIDANTTGAVYYSYVMKGV